MAEKEDEEDEDEEKEKEEAERWDETYATITTSAAPSMGDVGGSAMGISSRAGSCCSARRGRHAVGLQ